jgi:hypothetical protein
MKRLLLLSLLLLPLSALAQPVLYATQACGRCDADATGLYTIDPATGATTLVGDTGESITGLDFHPGTGVLYGTTTPNSNTPSSLITIDPATGTVTVIGPHGVDRAVTDLTFAPDGTLYGWAEPGFDSVVTIDVTTGAATLVADAQVNSGGCAFDMAPDGFLYLFGASCSSPLNNDGDNAVLKLNATSGVVVDYWPIITDASWECDSDETGAWSAASHDGAGNLYGFSNAGCGDGVPRRNLTTLDLATGVPTFVGISLDYASGLAFIPGGVGIDGGSSVPIPSMQTIGVLITIAFFMLLGGLMAYRRQSV